MPGLFQRLSRGPVVRVSAIVLLAALVSTFLFSPNFLRWLALGTPFILPEVARANDALRQLQHPFVGIDNYTSRVLQWRLFFPLLGHVLRLPPTAYLALPHLGCLLVLTFIVRLMGKHGFDGWESFAGAMVMATCSWFFVSMGLLGFFDSWYVLGLLFLVFVQDRRGVVAAIFITPWIDERFVIMLPLCLVLRWQYFKVFYGPRDARADLRGMAWLCAALLPWLLVRVGAFASGHDPVTGNFVRDMPAHQGAVKARSYLLGAWEGARWAWLFVAAWLVLSWRENRWRSVWLLPAFLFTLGLNLAIAEDISRSVSTVVPVIVLGLLLFKQHQPLRLRPVLFAACALNLIFPAAHVVGDSVMPIQYFYAALQHTLPAGKEAAFYYNQDAIRLAQVKRTKEALVAVNIAIELNPAQAEAYVTRAEIYANLGRLGEALADANHALVLDPRSPAAWHHRARLRLIRGDLAGAFTDFDQALRCAPPDWPRRAEVLAAMEKLRSKTAVAP
jgi:hypothetical protein